MKALLQIGFVRQCVPGRRLVFVDVVVVATCALAFARYRADLSLSLSMSLSRLMAASRLKTKPIPNQSKANQKPNLSHDCRQSVFVSYIDYVSLLLLL